MTFTSSIAGRRPFRGLAQWMLILALLVVAPSGLIAASADQAFEKWIEGLWPEARAIDVSRETFDAALKGLKPNRSLPDLILPGRSKKARRPKGQAEFVKPPRAYLREKNIKWLTKRGQALGKTWSKTLTEIEARFGVRRSVLLAIWGRETVYGSYKLRHGAIRALATQAYLGRRKDFFRKELLLALKILEEGHIDLKNMRASWAGAMGLTQFLPSNFYDYAVDFDGDGKRDIWRSVPDSLASTAKSLIDNGWQGGKTWGYEAIAPKKFDCTLEGPDHRQPIRAWLKLGFARTHGRSFSADRLDEEAYVLMPEGTLGPAFLMLQNFQVIKTYNFADLYALFVGHLADRIAGGGLFQTKWATSRTLATRLVEELQERLNTKGFDAGKVDGKVGPKTRTALGAYQKARNIKLDCWPSVRLVKHLRRAS